MLKGKNILLGITAGIAAYKIPYLVRLLVKAGAEVKVVMSPSASDFVTKKTLAVLSKNQVYDSFYDTHGNWNNHVELGIWADLFVIAPSTANSLSKMANGACDNLLLACYLSCRTQVMVYPAMDLDMWLHPSVQNNIETLKGQGLLVKEPNSGALASGLEGQGRMPEPEEIFEHVQEYFEKGKKWLGKKVLITAGPTQEAIDPVRFIGNHSSGKMGIALAEHFEVQGAEVDLVLGPVSKQPDIKAGRVHPVTSAEEMLAVSEKHFNDADVVIFCAAVADYRVAEISNRKIKREGVEDMTLELVQNPDIAASLSKQKNNQICVGFALETHNAMEYAKAKLKKKNLDAIVLNKHEQQGEMTFGSDKNQVHIFNKDNKEFVSEFKSKKQIAEDIETCLYHWYFN